MTHLHTVGPTLRKTGRNRPAAEVVGTLEEMWRVSQLEPGQSTSNQTAVAGFMTRGPGAPAMTGGTMARASGDDQVELMKAQILMLREADMVEQAEASAGTRMPGHFKPGRNTKRAKYCGNRRRMTAWTNPVSDALFRPASSAVATQQYSAANCWPGAMYVRSPERLGRHPPDGQGGGGIATTGC